MPSYLNDSKITLSWSILGILVSVLVLGEKTGQKNPRKDYESSSGGLKETS